MWKGLERRLPELVEGTQFEDFPQFIGGFTSVLYHVVPGATVTYEQARRSDGAVLTTALDGSTVEVDVLRHRRVALVDADQNDANPIIVRANSNKGNVQIAHGIDRVLRPVDLP